MYTRGPPRKNQLKPVHYSCPKSLCTGCSVSLKLQLGEHYYWSEPPPDVKNWWNMCSDQNKVLEYLQKYICDYFSVDDKQSLLSLKFLMFMWWVWMWGVSVLLCMNVSVLQWGLFVAEGCYVKVMFVCYSRPSLEGNNWLCWWPYKLALIASNNELECPLIYL